jgi:tRNA G18 (ribose-2'-O)-methylase SpoU
MRQLTHLEFERKEHKLSIIIVCDKLESAANLGSVFRAADAFGVSSIFLHNDNKNLLNQPRFKKTSRHSFKQINVNVYSDYKVILHNLKSKGIQIVALEKCDQSIRLQDISFSDNTCLIVGNENTGIHPIFLKYSEHVAHIGMFGKNSSMNAAQALSIGLYECVRQLV